MLHRTTLVQAVAPTPAVLAFGAGASWWRKGFLGHPWQRPLQQPQRKKHFFNNRFHLKESKQRLWWQINVAFCDCAPGTALARAVPFPLDTGSTAIDS